MDWLPCSMGPDVWAIWFRSSKFALCSLFLFSTCNCQSFVRSWHIGAFACIYGHGARRVPGVRYGCALRVCARVYTCALCVCCVLLSTARQRIFFFRYFFFQYGYIHIGVFSIQYSVFSIQLSVRDSIGLHLRSIWYPFGDHLQRIW